MRLRLALFAILVFASVTLLLRILERPVPARQPAPPPAARLAPPPLPQSTPQPVAPPILVPPTIPGPPAPLVTVEGAEAGVVEVEETPPPPAPSPRFSIQRLFERGEAARPIASPPPAGAAVAAGPLLNELLAAEKGGRSGKKGEKKSEKIDEGEVDGPAGKEDDWVELYHPGKEPFRLAGCRLSNDPSERGKWIFPDVAIAPGGFLLVKLSRRKIADPADAPGTLRANFRLPRSGGWLLLDAPDGRPIDSVAYPSMPEERSYGRTGDGGPAWALQASPTPGKANLPAPEGLRSRETVLLDPPPGRYPGPIAVRIIPPAREDSAGEALQVLVATDGSEPRPGSPAAGKSIAIEKSTLIRCAAFAGGQRVTPVVTGSYFIGPAPALPIVSIALDPSDFRDVHLGARAHGRTTERRAHLEIADLLGHPLASVDFGLRLHGGAGRQGGLNVKKSYKACFREEHGGKKLHFPLFPSDLTIPGKPAREFQKLVLRAGYNDRLRPGRGEYNVRAAYIRDQVLRDLHGELGGPYPHGIWCLLYINLEPKGLYNLVERPDDAFLRSYLDGGDWDVLKTGFWDASRSEEEVVAGTRGEWDRLRSFVGEHDLSRPEDYRKAGEMVDLPGFTRYMILNLWAQNEDWPQNNWYAGRSHEAGAKWIFLSWDVEWGMGLRPWGYQAPSFDTFDARPGGLIRELFQALKGNAEYRELFRKETTRLLEGGPLRPENVLRRVRLETERIAPLMEWELGQFGAGFTMENWHTNLRAIESFARHRNPVFLQLTEQAMGR